MAFAALDTVISSTAILNTSATPPLLGTVESISPTIVAWSNGTRVSYAADDDLLKVNPSTPAAVTALLTRRVQLDPAVSSDVGQRAQGVCIQGFNLVSAGGVDQGDVCVVRFGAFYRMFVTTFLSAVEG